MVAEDRPLHSYHCLQISPYEVTIFIPIPLTYPGARLAACPFQCGRGDTYLLEIIELQHLHTATDLTLHPIVAIIGSTWIPTMYWSSHGNKRLGLHIRHEWLCTNVHICKLGVETRSSLMYRWSVVVRHGEKVGGDCWTTFQRQAPVRLQSSLSNDQTLAGYGPLGASLHFYQRYKTAGSRHVTHVNITCPKL